MRAGKKFKIRKYIIEVENSAGKKRTREESGVEAGEVDDSQREARRSKLPALTTSRGTRKSGGDHYGNGTSTSKNQEIKSREVVVEIERIPNVLFVTRYGHTKPIFEKDIEDLFRPYGSFERVTMKGNISFVDFGDASDAARAKKELHQSPALNSDSIIVDFKKISEGNADKVCESQL